MITKQVADELAREALERASPSERPRPKLDMANYDERMRVAEQMLGNALETVERAMVVARSTMAFFMAEYTAIRAQGDLPKPPQLSPETVDRINAVARPKTFNQSTVPQPPAGPEKDDGHPTT